MSTKDLSDSSPLAASASALMGANASMSDAEKRAKRRVQKNIPSLQEYTMGWWQKRRHPEYLQYQKLFSAIYNGEEGSVKELIAKHHGQPIPGLQRLTGKTKSRKSIKKEIRKTVRAQSRGIHSVQLHAEGNDRNHSGLSTSGTPLSDVKKRALENENKRKNWAQHVEILCQKLRKSRRRSSAQWRVNFNQQFHFSGPDLEEPLSSRYFVGVSAMGLALQSGRPAIALALLPYTQLHQPHAMELRFGFNDELREKLKNEPLEEFGLLALAAREAVPQVVGAALAEAHHRQQPWTLQEIDEAIALASDVRSLRMLLHHRKRLREVKDHSVRPALHRALNQWVWSEHSLRDLAFADRLKLFEHIAQTLRALEQQEGIEPISAFVLSLSSTLNSGLELRTLLDSGLTFEFGFPRALRSGPPRTPVASDAMVHTPMMICARRGRQEYLRLLLSKAPADALWLVDAEGKSALDLALENGKWEAAECIVQASQTPEAARPVSNKNEHPAKGAAAAALSREKSSSLESVLLRQAERIDPEHSPTAFACLERLRLRLEIEADEAKRPKVYSQRSKQQSENQECAVECAVVRSSQGVEEGEAASDPTPEPFATHHRCAPSTHETPSAPSESSHGASASDTRRSAARRL